MKKYIGFLGRLVFLAFFVFFALFFASKFFSEGQIAIKRVPIEILILSGSWMMMLFGFLSSFINSKAGGMIIFFGGVFNASYLLTSGLETAVVSAVIFGGPFILSGLMIFSARVRKRKNYH